MATKTATRGRVLVAKETFTKQFEGAPVHIQAGIFRVREGHPILEGVEDLFEEVQPSRGFEVESATAAPGEVRG